ncbi:MAG: DUF4852 domain-containing protein [Rickettsiales bacterium]|nr:DUF4852 domain-containing protein [Rickettsiales bacterium]
MTENKTISLNFIAAGTKLLVVTFLCLSFILTPLHKSKANISEGWISSLNYNYTWDNFLIGSISLYRQFPYNAFVDSYLKKYHLAKWTRFHQDEFMWGQIRQDAVDEMKRKVRDFKLNHNFSIFGVFRFGDYDFSSESFFFEPFEEGTFIGIEDKQTYGFPSEFKIRFENYDAIRGIQMTAEEAQELIATRPISNGRIQRHLYGELKFRLSRLQDRKLTYPYTVIIADIHSLTLYTDQARTDLVASYMLRSSSDSSVNPSVTPDDPDDGNGFNSNSGSGFDGFRPNRF